MFPRHAVIVTAAGSSTRFASADNIDSKKEFVLLDGKSVLYKAVSPFTEIANLACIVITYKANTLDATKACLGDLQEKGIPFYFAEGGATRQESVFNGLSLLASVREKHGFDVVCIHDGARPFVTKETIMDCIAYAKLFGGAAPGIKITDTLVHVNEDGVIDGKLERDGAYQIQTPQVFTFPDIYDAHIAAKSSGLEVTDDTGIFTAYGKKVVVVAGSPDNKKITFRTDIVCDDSEEHTTGCTGNCSTCHGLCMRADQ